MDRLQKAAADLLENRVPIPNKDSDYVTRFHIKALRDALEAETNRRNKQAEEIIDSREILLNIHAAVTEGNISEALEVCGYIEDHFARLGVCAKCGSSFFVHDADGSCTELSEALGGTD